MAGALTRIRNNQVYSSDIDAATKLVPGSITGGLFNPVLTYTGNLTVGNLFVNGLTTTLDTTNIVAADPLVVLNRLSSGTPTYDIGLVLGRGNQTNTAFIWNESNKEFAFTYTTESLAGTTTGTINNSGYANIHAYGGLFNNVNTTSATIGTSTVTNFVSGNVKITGGTIDNATIGATTPNSGVFTSVATVSGGQLTGYHTGAIGANTANTGVFTTLTATSGYQGTASGPLNGTLGATTPNSVVATSVTTTSGGQLTGYLTGPVGANTANTGAFTTLTATGTGTFAGTITAATINALNIGNTGATITGTHNGPLNGPFNGTVGATTANTGVFTTLTATSGYQGAASGPLNGTLGATTPNSVVATSVTTTSGGQVVGYMTGPIGANTANIGVFTTVTTTSGGQVTGYLTGPVGANTANTGVFTTLTATSGYQGAASGPINGTVGAGTPNTGVFTTLTATSGFQGAASGPLNGTLGATTPNTGVFTTLTATSGFQGAASGPLNGTLGATTPNSVVATSVATTSGGQLTGYHTGTIGANTANTGVFTSVTTVSGGQVVGYMTGPIGANTANTGAFTTLTATSGFQGGVSGPLNGTLGATTPNSVVATSVTTTAGGQVTGYLTGPVGANTANTGVFTSVTTVSGGQLTGYITGPVGANTANTGVFTTLTATSGYQGAASGPLNGTLGATTPNSVVATSVTTTAGGQVTGYLTGPVGANTANTGAFTTLSSSGITTVTNSTNATGLQTGAFQVSLGGASIQQDLWVGGNIYGNITSQVSTILGVNDPLLYLNASNPQTYNYDIGFYSHFYGGAANNYQHTAFIRNFQDNVWYLVSNIPEPSAGDVNITYGNIIYDSLKLGTLTTANSNVSVSTVTGAIVSTGGVGIGGNLYVGGGINGIIGNGTAAAGTFTTLTATSGYQGAASGPLNGTLGATTPNSVVATSVTTTSGGQVIGYITGAIGANTANTGVFTTVTTTNGGQLTGYHTGAIGANTANTGVFTSVTTTAGGQVTGYLTGALGANTPNSVVATSVTTTNGGQLTGYLTGPVGANTANTGVFTTLTATSGYQGAASGPLNGTLGATTPNSVVATSVTTTSGGQLTGYHTGAIGANTANSGVFTSVTTVSGGQVVGYMTGPIGANTANTGAFTSVTTTAGGQLTGYLTGAIGANTANTGVFTNVTTVSGGQVTGYITGAIGANTANTGAFTTVSASTSITAGTIQLWAGNNTITGATVNAIANGGATGPLNGTLGATTPNTVVATSIVTVSGGQISGYLNGALGANTPNSVVATSVTTTNGGQLTGYHTGAIGANTANTGAFTTLTTTGNLVINAITETTAANIGALVIPNGGISVTGNAYIANNLYIGPSAFNKNLTVPTIIAVDSGSTYAQLAMINTAGSGSADFAAYADNGTDAAGWVDMGIAGSTFNDPAYTITKANDGYLLARPFSNSFGGNLVLATSEVGSYNDIVLAAGSFYSNAEVARFHGNVSTSGNLTIKYTTAATNTTSGALQVAGGAGIAGNVYSGSWLNATTGAGTPTVGVDTVTPYSTTNININTPVNGNVVINNNGFAANLVVQGNSTAGYSNLLVTNGTTGQVGIKIAPNAIQSGSSFHINATDSMVLPVGSVGQRPTVGQVTKGMMRFNNTSNIVEFWDGTVWNTGGATFTLISADSFTGTGSQTTFTLSQSGTTASVMVAINGVIQIPTTAYSVSGTSLIFTEAPLSTDIIDARTLSTTTTVSSVSDGTTSITLSNSASVIYQTVQNTNVFVATKTLTTMTGNLIPSANVTYNIGSATANWNNVYAVNFAGTSTTAKYADLAENYAADAEYEPGTVLEFGGDSEVTVSNNEGSPYIAGVVSTNPAHLMNSAIEAEHPVALALTGRVPCKIIGPVYKGQMMISAGGGRARAAENPAIGTVIGKAVENFGEGEGIIEVVVGRI